MVSIAGMDLTVGLTLRALGFLALAGLVRFFTRLYHHRTSVRAMAKKYDLPLLPHSFILGHLGVVGKVVMKYPKEIASQTVPLLIMREYPEVCKAGAVYLDIWPAGDRMLAVFHPDMMAQFCQEPSRPKHNLLHTEFRPLSNCDDLVNQEGADWKLWRSIFNPGFSTKNILTLVPSMIDEIQVFKKWLEKVAASGEEVKLEDQATRLTVDIIGRAVLDTKLNAQITPVEPLMSALKSQISWLIYDNSPGNLLKAFNPFRPLIMGYHNRTLRNAIMPSITKAIQERGRKEGSKTICSLAVNAYVKESPGVSSADELDPRFTEILLAQIKIFMFAGHDTTATTICFAYHRLWENPEALAALRAEHDEVLGSDPREAEARITENPSLLSKLVYTHAILKETLRLYPPVGSIRSGGPDFFITQPETGAQYATDDWMIFSCSSASQRNEWFWPRPDDFVPERWLAKEGEPLHVGKNLFRPFELGPRNCIGQELAVTEMKLILALTVRELDIRPMFPQDGPRVFGDLGYQVVAPGEVTAHTKLGMPVTVAVRKQ